MHNVAFTVDEDDNIVLVYHPNDETARRASLALGEVTEDRRAGYVWPYSPFKRVAFRLLRRMFGGRGRVADWTRTWRGAWIVVDAATGEWLPGVWPSHEQAVEAEVRWSLAHGFPKVVLGGE